MVSEAQAILRAHRVKELTKESLENVRQRIIANMGAKKRNASMRSVKSLSVRMTEVGGTLYGLSSFLAMEKGRKGGKVPRNFQDIIASWIVAKGISLYSNAPSGRQPTVKRVSYLIARSIQQKGSRMHRNGQFQDIFSKASKDEVTKLSDKIMLLAASNIDYLHTDLANLKQ